MGSSVLKVSRLEIREESMLQYSVSIQSRKAVKNQLSSCKGSQAGEYPPLTVGGSALLLISGPLLTDQGPPTLERAICFTQSPLRTVHLRGAYLAQLLETVTLDFGVLSLIPLLNIEII